MKCLNCPLCVSDRSYYDDDCDIYCLVTGDFANAEGGCRRTNKFILNQSPQKLKDERAKEEAERWSEFADYLEQLEREMNDA